MPLKKVFVSKLKLVHVLNESQMDYSGFLITGYKDFDEREGVGFIVSAIRFLFFADRQGKAFFQLGFVPNGFEIHDMLNSSRVEKHRLALDFDPPRDTSDTGTSKQAKNLEKQQHANQFLVVEWDTTRTIHIRPVELSSGFICHPDSKRRRVDCKLT